MLQNLCPKFLLLNLVSIYCVFIGRGHRRIGSDGYSEINMAPPPSMISIQKSPPATIQHVSTYPGAINSGSRETTPTPHTGQFIILMIFLRTNLNPF